MDVAAGVRYDDPMLARLAGGIKRVIGRVFGRRVKPEPTPEVMPDTTEGTVAPLRQAVRRSLVPRWLAALRTQVFTGVAAFGLMVFGGLTLLVETGLTAGPDLMGSLAVQQVEHPWVSALMAAVSAPGFMPLSLFIVGGVGGLLWLSGYRRESAFALLASASTLLTEAIKMLVGRPRPDAGSVRVAESVAGLSFPSGHTLFYVTFFGFVGYAGYALLKPGRLRTALLWICGALILLVGPSRVWLGHHWPSDVLASYALGLAYLILLVQAYSRVRLRPAA
jgi:undecaprenyl-diphosphatase